MGNKIFTVAIIGTGGRGGYVYGTLIHNLPDKFKIVALCDIKPQKLNFFAERFGVSEENLFTDEKIFFEKKRADVLVIATQDKDHVRHATCAFNLGYDVLLEKPITDNKEEMENLLKLQKEKGCKALVCHVLRYAPAFVKVSELIKQGAIGRLVSINAIEQVGYTHQAQAYVRGYWRKEEDSTPMILAKCCHDLDLLQYYANSRCESVSSVGDLTFFKRECAPEGASQRCIDCKYADTCAYSAKTYYLDNWLKTKPIDAYPYNVPCLAPVTEEKIVTALKTGPYGICVFKCDNNVVDHQITQMTFENGVKATLTMIAFTRFVGRRMEFFGTHGQITLDEVRDFVRLSEFGKDEVVYKISDMVEKERGHGGGDYFLVQNLYEIITGNGTNETAMERSAESHLMGISAEISRKQNGKLIKVHED